MNKIELAKVELIDTIGRYNLTVSNIAKMQFNKRETDLFANMMIEFADKLNNAKIGTTDNCNIPDVSNRLTSLNIQEYLDFIANATYKQCSDELYISRKLTNILLEKQAYISKVVGC